jgi:dihydroorotate dehydrogenase electron transfer subunit
MRKLANCPVIGNWPIASGIYELLVEFPEDLSDARAGQFAEIFVGNEKNLLPRPISICEIDREKSRLRLIYQVVGEGTARFSELKPGGRVRLIAPVGNGYNISSNRKKIAVVGGGAGVPPMLELARAARAKNPEAEISVILGFRSEALVILTEDFERLGFKPIICTDDGSVGFKGNVVDFMRATDFDCDIVYACGPKIMLKFLWKRCEEKNIACFVSMEERMGCGLGVCVGCALLVKPRNPDGQNFYKKVCKDGPVFNAKEVVWE